MGEKVVINVGRNGRYALSYEALEWLAMRGDTSALWHIENPDLVEYVKRNGADPSLWRTDSLLIECIEALGDKANPSRTQLKIVELPDDVGEWQIDEVTHGVERVIEVGRSWE